MNHAICSFYNDVTAFSCRNLSIASVVNWNKVRVDVHGVSSLFSECSLPSWQLIIYSYLLKQSTLKFRFIIPPHLWPASSVEFLWGTPQTSWLLLKRNININFIGKISFRKLVKVNCFSIIAKWEFSVQRIHHNPIQTHF